LIGTPWRIGCPPPTLRQGPTASNVCAELLSRYAARPGAAAAVREQLLGHHGRLPTQREVARALGVSERTLHRQLTDDGASFRQLRDAVLRTLAEGMIAAHPELTLAQISTALGYDHPASFTRAYRRWTGQRPSEVRVTCHEDQTRCPHGPSEPRG
jgi:AraC-like DNA-binding protein